MSQSETADDGDERPERPGKRAGKMEGIEQSSRDQNYCPDYLWDMPILREGWNRMHNQNKNLMICIVGETGSGKSWAALRVAQLLDPDFSIDQVAFDVEQFVDLVNDESQGQGSMIVMDEAGVSMDNRTWYDQEQIGVGHILETWRHQNRGAIWTLPTFDHLDKKAKRRMHALMLPQHINPSENKSQVKFYWIERNETTGETWREFHRTSRNGVTFVHKGMELYPPTMSVREPYERKKDQFTDDLNERVRESMEDDAEDEIDESAIADGIIEEIKNGGGDQFIRLAKNTGQPMIDDALIYNEFDGLSQRGAERVKKVVESQVTLEER